MNDRVNDGPLFGMPPGTVKWVSSKVDPIRRIGRYAIYLRGSKGQIVTYEFSFRAFVAGEAARRYAEGLLRALGSDDYGSSR